MPKTRDSKEQTSKGTENTEQESVTGADAEPAGRVVERIRKPPTCTLKVTRNQLKRYLFREHAGAELDQEGQEIRQHLAGECSACARQIIEIESAEPLLRGEARIRPALAFEIVRKESDATLSREALAAEVSRQAAALLATTAPFSFSDLAKMNARIRTVGDPEKRKMIAAEVARVCNARWRRVLSSGTQFTIEIEAAAAMLFSRIRKRDENCTPNEIGLKELGISSSEGERYFLLYMMTNTWFLHPEGESPWDTNSARQEATGESKTDLGSAEKIVLFVDVLRQALQRNFISDQTKPSGIPSV